MEIRKISKAEREQFIDLEFMSFGEKLPKIIDEAFRDKSSFEGMVSADIWFF